MAERGDAKSASWSVRPIRLVTYNIHKGLGGVDRRYRLDRIIEVLTHCRGDIMLLQEVDDGVPRSRHDRQVELLAEALGIDHFVYQPNVRLKRGQYGNAILSRFPVEHPVHLELTIPLKKRRRALAVHARIPVDGRTRTLVVINAHLGLAGFERAVQMRRILESPVVRRTRRQTPIVVGGDLNDVWATLGKRLLRPAGFQPTSWRIKTFPAAYPLRALDWLFLRGDIAHRHTFAARTRTARQASDHLPLVSDLWIGRESSTGGGPADDEP